MSSNLPFRELIRRVRAGDDKAATELVRLYEPHVRRAVRIRMNQPRLRQVVDSMDICQSVLARFFVRAASGQFRLDTPKQLVALLVTMAENRIRDWQRRQSALRRDKKREIPLTALADVPSRESADGVPEADGNPAEALELLVSRLPAAQQRLARSRFAGQTWAEIADREGKTPDALRMQLRRSVDRLLQQLEHGASGCRTEPGNEV